MKLFIKHKKYILRQVSILLFCFPLVAYESLDFDFLKESMTKTNKSSENTKNNNKKNFNDLIKGYNKIEGLFTYYWNKDNNKCYIAIKKNQFDEYFIASLTRQRGDGYRYDGSSMLNEFTFSFKKSGNNVQIIRNNVKFRAQKDSAIFKAIENNISGSIFSFSKIEAISSLDSLFLVDATNLFIFDFSGINSRGKYILDKKNSYFNSINSFTLNSELGMTFHYKGKKTGYIYTLPSSTSMLHKYHISLSQLSNSDYKPRLADDRVGHFTTIYQDYTNVLSNSPYVRYINRWHLEKKNPSSRLSRPKEPIVYWIENTVPLQFRKAIRDGILGWNKSFEKIGFKNAVEVKQMPDDAEWDPADIRYNTIRWMIHPGAGYAVGPSRANPITGELYDADIRISTDYVRFFYTEYKDIISPLIEEPLMMLNESKSDNSKIHECNYSFEKKNQMAFLWNYMTTNKIIDNNSQELEKFVYEGIVDLIMHEVGHTLGLRHNFKASSILSVDQLSDSDYISNNNITSSVMDYTPANILDKGNNFFLTKPGVYDDWAIEYAYSDCNNFNNEKECLDNIISRSISNPLLVYGTDEDTDDCDPFSTRYDMSSDPIEYYNVYLELIQVYWDNLLGENMIDGNRYSEIRNKFSQGIYEYYRAARQIPKFIGGVYYSRHHIGDIDKDPFSVVTAEDQRRAINFLDKFIFAESAFNFSAELLNKLAPTRLNDFEGSLYEMNQLDYPIHKIIKNLQIGTLNRIFSFNVITRTHNNELRFNNNEEIFTLFELFYSIKNIVWRELYDSKPINNFRREIQSHHIDLMENIYSNKNLPIDSQNLALETMKDLYKTILNNSTQNNFDNYTNLHLINMKAKLEAILDIESSYK